MRADESHKVAIIPGVILGQDTHAFVQVLDGTDGTTAYLKFPSTDSRADDWRFAIEIGENRFDDRHLHFALYAPQCQLAGEIHLGPLNPWPVTVSSPGVMGWYAWVPGMECYQGVLSFSHTLEGTLDSQRQVYGFWGWARLHREGLGAILLDGVDLVSEQSIRWCGCLSHRLSGDHSLDRIGISGICRRPLGRWKTASLYHVQRVAHRIAANIRRTCGRGAKKSSPSLSLESQPCSGRLVAWANPPGHGPAGAGNLECHGSGAT